MITPKGTFITGLTPPGGIPPGTPVVVTGAVGLDRSYEGRSGELLGYTTTHGYAVVAADGGELLVHPESLAPKA